MSPDGSGMVVWSGPDGNDGYSVFARELEANGALGPKLTLSAPDPEAAFASAYAPAVRYDGQGTATVVWMETTYGSESCFNEEGGSGGGEGEECEVDEYVLARQVSGAGSPSAVRQLQHRHAVYPDEGSFGGSNPAYVTYGQPALAGGPADTLTVVWSEGAFGSGCAAYGYSTTYADSECEAQGDIKWTRLDSDAAPLGSPQSAYTNETSGYGSGQPLLGLRVGAAADGTATVLFGARETAAEEGCWGGESTVGFLRIGPGGTATAPNELDSGCGTVRPDLALDPSGTATAVWGWAGTYSADEALLARIDPSGVAEEAHSLLDTTEGAHVSGLDVARGGAGAALAVWSEEGRIRSRRIPTSGSLAPTTTVATPAPGREFLAPRLAVASDDSAAVVWEAGSDSFATAYSLRAVDLAADGTPGQPRTLMAANRWNHGVRLSPGAAGTFLASWRISVPQHNRVQAAWFGTGAVQGNDDFEDASPLDPELPDFAAGSTAGATNQPEEPDHAGAGGEASVWYSWTPSESGPVTLITCADEGFDPALGVYTGATLIALTEVAAASDGAPAPCVEGDSGVRFDAVAGTTYRIAVDGEGESEGSFGLKLVSRQSAPTNDAFAEAKEIAGTPPRQLSGDNIDGSREPGEPEHGGEIGGASVWYSWTASRSAPASISVCGRDLSQPLLGVYTGATLAGLSAVGTQAGPTSGCSGGASVSFDAVAGITYRVAVDGRGGREGRFSLRFDQQPANDDLEGAQTISSFLPAYISGATFAATKQPQEPEHAGDPGGHSVWYSWTPSSSGTAFISACLFAGKDSPALLGVYTGTDVEHLSQVAADSAGGSSSGCYSRYSEVSFPFVGGTRYLIAVDSKGGAEASFSLNLEQLPGNDDVEDAQVIGPSLPLSVSGSNRHASKDPGEPEHAGDPGGHSVWYSWTPSESGNAILSACLFAGKNQSALLAVYSGPDSEDLSEVASDTGGGPSSGCFSRYSEVSFSFVAGTRYLIALDGPGGAQASFSMTLESRPANDDLEHARTISASPPQTVFGSTRHATKQSQEPEHAGEPGGASVWYSWTPGESGIAVLSACSWSGSPLLAAYTGSDFTDLAEVAAASGTEGGGGSCFGSTAEIEFDAVAGTRYLIAVDDEAGAGMWSFDLEVDLELAPANDDFAASQQISSNSSWFYGSNRHATKQVGEPNHGGEPGSASVWFSWTPEESGLYAIATCSYGALDPLLGVYTGSGFGGLDVVGSDDDGGNCSDGDAEVRFAAIAGTTYRIAVDGKSASTGDFQLRFGTPPANDDLAAATELSGEARQLTDGSNWLATKQSQEPEHAGDPGGASVWYSWAPNESSTVQLTVCSYAALDPLLAVYTGSSPEALVPVASDDIGEEPECSGRSTVLEIDAQAGIAYRIAVDGRGESYGDFYLALRSTPANDDFVDAAPLGAELPQSVYSDNRMATKQPQEPEHAGDPGASSVWYSWTPATSGPVILSTCSHVALDSLLAVYTGSSLATLEEVAADDDAEDPECSDDDAEVRFEAIAETTYWIAVDDKDENGGQFGLRLRAAGPDNDDFSDAIDIAQVPGRQPGTTIGASAQAGEPGSAQQSVWYRMQADHNGIVRLHTCSDVGAPMDLDVFTGSSLVALSPVALKPAATAAACGFAPGTSLFADTPALGFEAVAGTVYWISVDRYQQISPVFELRPPSPFSLVVDAPANDLRAAAERIPRAGASLARTNVGATHEPAEDEHAGNPGGASVWFRWFASADGPVSIETCGSEVDTLLSVFGASGGGGPGGSAEEEYSDDPPTPGGGGSAGEQYSDDPPPPPAPGGELASSDDSELCGPGATQSSVELEAHEGLHYLIAVDGKEGDVGPIQLTLVFDTPDTTPPETFVYIQPAVNTTAPAFYAFEDEPESSFECAVDGGAFAPCVESWSGEQATLRVSGLQEGPHAVAIRAVDGAGNPDPTPVEGNLVVDTVPPDTGFSAGPTGPTRELGPFEFDSTEVGYFECALDGGPMSFCNPPYSLPNSVADGAHTLHVRAVDQAGNPDPSPASRSFQLDRVAPTAAIESGPEGVIDVDDVSFEFGADESAIFQCRIDGGGAVPCISPRPYNNLDDGNHGFEVRAIDPAGNVGNWAERSFRVEVRPPQTTLISGPPARVATGSAHFEFGANEPVAGFECALDGAAFADCPASHDISGLGEGSHTLSVRATDLAGRTDPTPVERTWFVDADPPDTAVASGPSGLTRLLGPFGFSADEAVSGYECALDEGEFEPCTATGYFIASVPDGPHTLLVRAIDLAGNPDPSPATRALQVDRTPPKVELVDLPPAISASSSVSVGFTIDEAGATAQCRIDGQSFFSCGAPIEFTDIPDGAHTISVRAVDQAGNVGPVAGVDFVVDAGEPDTTIDSAPTSVGAGAVMITFHGTADTTAYECALDGGSFADCDSPASLTDLDEGPHEFLVRAVDAAGNLDSTPASAQFTVDLTPPDTTITAGPTGPVHAPLVPFEFASTESPELFECSMDGGPFEGCDGITHDRRLGTHEFAVRARDRVGNVDPSPATYPFEVVNTDPVVNLALANASGPAPRAVHATIGGSDPDGDSLHYTLQWGDGTESEGTAPDSAPTHTYTAPGVYLVRVEVDDGFGATAAVTQLVTATTPEPIEARAGDDLVAVVGEPVLLDGSDTRPLDGIDQFHWSLSNGVEANGARFTYTFDQPGDFEAELSVSGIGGSDSDTASVHVVPAPTVAVPRVFVHSGGTPLAGAKVLVQLPDGRRVQGITNGQGNATLPGLPDGSYTFFASKGNEYVAGKGQIDVVDGEGEGEVGLSPGPTVAVTVDWHRMTLEEIEAAGIDPDDPANQHVYSFVIEGNFVARINGNGFFGSGCTSTVCRFGGGGGPSYVSRLSRGPGGEPIVATMRIPAKATFLKEFYDVSVTIANLAPAGITLADGHASISVPSGMSIAPTATPQSAVRAVADIPGGGTRSVSWYLRGDREGEYDVAIHYTGILEPFGEPISAEGRTDPPIKVWGGSALELEVVLDGEARKDYPYTGFVKLRNVADVPVYNVALELPAGGHAGYIEQPRQRRSFTTRELAPGSTHVAGPLIAVPGEDGELDLARSVIRRVAGDVTLGGTIVSQEREPSFEATPELSGRWRNDRNLILEWDAVPGASGYEIYATPDRETEFAPTPLATSHQFSATKAMVQLDRDDPPLLAVSSLVGGERKMIHPLLDAAAAPLASYPSIEFVDQTRCGEPLGHARVRIEDPDFALTGWGSASSEPAAVVDKPASGHELTVFASGSRPGNGKLANLTVAVTNANPADGVKKRSTQLGRCSYVGLGDSFSSGEGSIDSGQSYEDSNGCHRSPNAYANLIALREDILLSHFRACSGAVAADLFRSNPDHAGENPQIEWISGADLVTLSIGGNDLHFGDVLSTCIPAYVAQTTLILKVPCKIAWGPIVDSGLRNLHNSLRGDLVRLRDEMAGDGRLILLGYPQIFPAIKPLGASFSCDLIHPSDISWMHDTVTRANAVLADIATRAGVEFVDPGAGGRFDGHDVCRAPGSAYFNGIKPVFNGVGLPSMVESFHPNSSGQSALHGAVEARINQADAGTRIDEGQSIFRSVLVEGSNMLRAGILWPGSDVELSLESPSGLVIDRAHVPPGVTHERGPTSESYLVPDPESGEWKLTATGLDVEAGGEPVSFEVSQAAPEPEPPLAIFTPSTLEGTAPLAVQFDATDSFDPADQALTYVWGFGDGSSGSGVKPTHTFTQAGEYVVELTVTDSDGETDSFESLPIVVAAEAAKPPPSNLGGAPPPTTSQPSPAAPPSAAPPGRKALKCKKGFKKKKMRGKTKCVKVKKKNKKRGR